MKLLSSIIKSSYVVQSNDVDYKNHIDLYKEKMLKEAQEECEEIINEAKEKAKKIVENANIETNKYIQEANSKTAEIIEDARKTGYEEGYIEGKKIADELIREANIYKKEYLNQKDNILNQTESDIVTLVLNICSKIIGKTIDEDSEAILDIIFKGINSLNARESLTIRVSKEDYDVVEMSKERILAMANLVEDIEIKSDISLKPGGCIIETSKGNVDVSIDTQLKEIKNLLKELLHSE